MFYVSVYCGYSDWFKGHDVRAHEPYETQGDAMRAKRELDSLSLTGREGEPIEARVFNLSLLEVGDYAHEFDDKPGIRRDEATVFACKL